MKIVVLYTHTASRANIIVGFAGQGHRYRRVNRGGKTVGVGV